MDKIPMTHQTKEHFVNDKFGDKLGTTTDNLITSIIFFVILIAPFIAIGLAMYYFHDGRIIHYMHFLLWFFGCWAVFFLLEMPILTLITNHRTRHLYHRRVYYNYPRLVRRKDWLHDYYRKKFGTGLHHKKIYTVAKNNNIPVDYIIRTYQKAMSQK